MHELRVEIIWALATLRDTVSALQAHAMVALAALALVAALRRRFATAGLALAAALGIAANLAAAWPEPSARAALAGPSDETTLVVSNIRRSSTQLSEAIAVLLAEDPDILVLVEAPDDARPEIDAALEGRGLPHRVESRLRFHQLLVASRLPMRSAWRRLREWSAPSHLFAEVMLEGGALRLGALHFPAAFTPSHNAARESLETLSGYAADPMVATGDLNAVPWNATPRRVASALGLRLSPDWRPTWLPRLGPLDPIAARLRPWIGLPLDQTLLSPQVEIVSRRLVAVPGSDHLAQVMRLRVGFPPPR